MKKELIGLFLVLASIVFNLIYFYDWLGIDQFILHHSLFTLFLLLFKKELTLFHFGLLSVAATFVNELDLIDGYFYKWLYKNSENFNPSNPQKIKLYLFTLGLIILLLLFLKKNQRSVIRYFVALSTACLLAVTGLVHSQVVGSGLISLVNEDQRYIAELMKQSSNNYDSLINFCQSVDLKCGFVDSVENFINNSNLDSNIILQARRSLNENMLKPVHFSFTSENGRWQRLTVGIKKTSENKLFYFLSDNRIQNYQVMFENIFSILMTAAHFIWGPLLILLGLFHHQRLKNKFAD